MSEPVFFSQMNVNQVMHLLITAFERQLFPIGATPRPQTITQEGDANLTMTSSGQPLVANAFGVAPVHIPNAGDDDHARHSYKSELVLVRDPEVGTKKILWWYDKDPRNIPHNHPWDFRSGILYGGYTEERFWLSSGVVKKERKQYTAGMINEVPADVFHNVIDVLPGTATYLDCGPARVGNEWGYMDTSTGDYSTFKKLTPPNF